MFRLWCHREPPPISMMLTSCRPSSVPMSPSALSVLEKLKSFMMDVRAITPELRKSVVVKNSGWAVASYLRVHERHYVYRNERVLSIALCLTSNRKGEGESERRCDTPDTTRPLGYGVTLRGKFFPGHWDSPTTGV